MAVVIESTISTAVHTQAVSVCAELLPIFMRYCIISGGYIFTAIDNNFDLWTGWDYYLNSRPQHLLLIVGLIVVKQGNYSNLNRFARLSVLVLAVRKH